MGAASSICRSRPLHLIMVAAAICLPLVSFAPILAGSQMLAFRDISHFYRPLLIYLESRQADSLFPLWSPLDHFGAPLAGETSTALFYPGRVVFWIGLPRESAIGLYIAGHLVLAAAGGYRVVRQRSGCVSAAVTAAVGYAFSGCVLFLYTNPPFLVGAAYLPWMVAGIQRVLQTPTPTNILITALPFAAATLGGDPQMCLHVALLVIGWWTLARGRAWMRRRGRWTPRRLLQSTNEEPYDLGSTLSLRSNRRAVAALLLSALVTAGLAAPQLAASYSWSSQSWRSASRHRSLWEEVVRVAAPIPSTSDDRCSLWQRPTPGTHAADSFQFSLPPWGLSQLFSPYIAGDIAGQNERWMNRLPGAPRNWTPTIYIGMLPPLLLIVSCGWPRQIAEYRWLVMGLVGLALALGQFGFVYWLRSLVFLIGGGTDWPIPDAVGGPYWWLTAAVPGYGEFRYPSKWLPIAALGLSTHGAILLSRLDASGWQRLRTSAGIVVGIAVVLLVGTWSTVWRDWLQAGVSDPAMMDRFWGPLDIDATSQTIHFSLFHTIGFALAIVGCSWHRHRLVMIALVSVLEMTFVAHWQLFTVAMVESGPQVTLANGSTDDFSSEQGKEVPSINRGWFLKSTDPWPTQWRSHLATDDRMREVEAGQRNTWFIRWHLPSQTHIINNSLSIRPAASQRLFGLAAKESQQTIVALARYLGVDYFLRRHGGETGQEPALEMVPVPAPLPLLRWHEHFQPADQGGSEATIHDLLEDLADDGQRQLPRISACDVARGESKPSDIDATGIAASQAETVIRAIDWVSPQRVTAEVIVARGGLLVAAWQQDGHWLARVHSQANSSVTEQRPCQVDEVFQGLYLSPGKYHIEFVYAPRWWWPAWILAILTWSLAIIWLVGKAWGGIVNKFPGRA